MTYSPPPLTLGVEEEYQIIDPATRNLHSYITELIAEDAQRESKLDLKPEFMQSQVEVGSRPCRNIKEIRDELIRLRRATCEMARNNGLRIVAASTHPFARWDEQNITDGVRYKELLDDMQGVARRLLIFGMHVHVGFGHKQHPENKDLMIEIMKQARYFIPHLLALSTSSPFWHGRNTGLKSYRSVIFESLPRTGIPYAFDSWAEYYSYERTLDRVGSFGKGDTVAKIWWDIRPHPVYDTLEFRICDICTRVDEAVCIAALFQAIVAKLLKLRRQNLSWRNYHQYHITENKWRAVRYGIQGNLIDFGIEEERPFSSLIEELLDFVDDVVDELDSRDEVAYVHTILREGTSADRQLRVFNNYDGEGGDAGAMRAVIDHLIADTETGLWD
jgi:carboxylate-amine ligase